LAEGGYIERAEPVVLMGECGTGKTHLATGLCVAACRQKRRVRFTTAANLVNELVESTAAQRGAPGAGALDALRRKSRSMKWATCRWPRSAPKFSVSGHAERAERATLIVTTNLPFSEWTQVFPNPRLCKALLDRITDRAHIIETGTGLVSFPAHLGGAQQKERGPNRRQRRYCLR